MKKIAILTSGGDAPGMNAAVKGVVRTALNSGWQVFGVKDAYKGLVEGRDQIFPLDWDDVALFFREGGTLLGSVRFPQLRGDSLEAVKLKEKALMNLLQLGITGLVVIGGDGSLTGAMSLYSFLKTNETLHPELREMPLSIVGIPGSIDNDIALTDMSIGVDTTLNTIVECIDKLRDTAASHRRVIIVEVMGRLRGYLAVMSGLAAGADKILIREENITMDQLHDMLHVLQDSFALGQKAGIIVRSEGAFFSTGFIKETIEVLLDPKREVRETVLGHLQRGGTPTSFERVLGLRMGMKAVKTLHKGFSEPKIVVLRDNMVKAESLRTCLNNIQSPFFKENLSVNAKHAFNLGHRLENPPEMVLKGKKIAILTDGENVSGMNMAIRAVARLAMNEGIEVKGIKGGFEGLARGLPSVLNLEWPMLEMKGLLLRAGTLLGVSSNWVTEKDLTDIKDSTAKLGIDGLIIIGNHRAFQCSLKLAPMILLPIVGIPAALNCDIHNTDWSIGMDSASNDLMKSIDRSVDNAHVKKKICIICLKGGNCACLVEHVALAAGADEWIIQEGSGADSLETFIGMIREKVQRLKRLLEMGRGFATVVYFTRVPENTAKGLQLIRQIMIESGINIEITVIPLETNQGGVIPTAFDRVLAKRLGEKALTRLLEKMDTLSHTFDMVGISGKGLFSNTYHEHGEGEENICSCPQTLESELQDCFEQVSHPGDFCVGLGGFINWTDISKVDFWEGIWTCKKCGNTQEILFDSRKALCIKCEQEGCNNFGYIRSFRRF